MRLLITFFRMYPWQSVVMLTALLLAGLAEGVSITALLPLISIAMEQKNVGLTNNDMELSQSNDFAQAIIGTLQDYGITPSIGLLLSVIVVGIIIKNGFLLFAKKRIGYTAAQVTTRLRLDLLRAMLSAHWSYFLNQSVGKLANAMASEAVRASSAYVWGNTLIALTIHLTVYTVMALVVSWQATLLCLGAGIVFVFVSHFLVRMSRRAGKQQTRLLISLLARMTDMLQSVKPLKAMSREGVVDGMLKVETERLNKALQKQVLGKAALEIAQEPMYAIVIAMGIYVALDYWNMPFATILVLVMLLARVLKHIGNVQKQYQKMAICESAFWSLRDTIKQAESALEQPGGKVCPMFTSSIVLQEIKFSYGNRQVFNDLTLIIPANTLTVLTGPSGVGKTTIIDLITGINLPQSGEIKIDGTPLANVNLKTWRRKIGYVPQENILLHDTVINNVTLGDSSLTLADVEHALKAADAWEFVSQLPQKLTTIVGERGAKLSGGQRQRIMIARALVHHPKLLILDEATNALDPQSEFQICKTIARLRNNLTVVAISHQTALVEVANQVYNIDKGAATLVVDETVAAL